MLQPKKTKYRKAFKGRIHGSAKGGFSLNFGSYGLKTVEPERITARQIEAARRAITRQMKRQGRVWIRVFPDLPVTGKPAEVRMGKGKGAVDHWAARCHPGRILFEIDGVPDDIAREALRLGAAKLPVRTKVVTRLDAGIAHVEALPDDQDRRSPGANARPAVRRAAEAQEGTVQPALPGRHRPDGKDPSRSEVRKDIARISTLLRANRAAG
jgi:large subunit ribosomal protein L16